MNRKMGKIKYLTRPQICKITKEFLAHCKENVRSITPLTNKNEMFLWNRDKTLYVQKDEYEMQVQSDIFYSVLKRINPDLKDRYTKDDISNNFLGVFYYYVFDEKKVLTVDEWVYDWTNRKKIYTTYCFKIANIPVLERRVRFNSNIFIDKVQRIKLFKPYLQDKEKFKKEKNELVYSTVEDEDTALAIRVHGCESKKTYKKANDIAQKVIDCINVAYSLFKYPLQIKNWNIKEQESHVFPKFYETDAISVFINNCKKIEALSFEPHPNLQFVTQSDLRNIKIFINGMINLPSLLFENILMKRYQIAFNWLGQAIRDPLQYRGFLQGMISLDTFLSRGKSEIKNQKILTSTGQKVKLFTSSKRKSKEVDRLSWKKVQIADIVAFINKDMSFSRQEIRDKFLYYGDLRDEIVHDGLTTIDENEYKTFFIITVGFFMNVFIKIVKNNLSSAEDLWKYCHPEIINKRLESIE